MALQPCNPVPCSPALQPYSHAALCPAALPYNPTAMLPCNPAGMLPADCPLLPTAAVVGLSHEVVSLRKST